MKAISDKILLDRLIYLQIILFVPLTIFLLPVVLFPDSMPDSYWEFFNYIGPYLYNDGATDFLSPGLNLFENTNFMSAVFILWLACYVLLLKSKKIGVQLLYLLVAIDIFYAIYGGDQIYTPLFSSLTYIEGIALGMTLYLVTFSSIKNSFK
jgi:hypothetical protein